MKLQTLCFFALLGTMQAENLFSNPKMDTVGGWKGTKKIVDDPTSEGKATGTDGKLNRCLVLNAKKSEKVAFHQEVGSKGAYSITLRFRYWSKDYKGMGFEIRGVRADRSSTYTNRDLVTDGQWHEVNWTFSQIGSSRDINFVFTLLQGEGDVYFDDFSAEVKQK